MEKVYTVSWILTVETDSPIDAINECWHRLQKHSNDWIWEVLDEDTGKKYKVDMDNDEPTAIEL